MTLLPVVAGPALLVAACALTALAATLGMLGMARLELAAVHAEPGRTAQRNCRL